jgi:hypothetical protein
MFSIFFQDFSGQLSFEDLIEFEIIYYKTPGYPKKSARKDPLPSILKFSCP